MKTLSYILAIGVALCPFSSATYQPHVPGRLLFCGECVGATGISGPLGHHRVTVTPMVYATDR